MDASNNIIVYVYDTNQYKHYFFQVALTTGSNVYTMNWKWEISVLGSDPSFMFSHDSQLKTFYWAQEDQNSIGSFDIIRFQDNDGSVLHHLLLTHNSLTEGSTNFLTRISNYYDTAAAQVYSGGCL